MRAAHIQRNSKRDKYKKDLEMHEHNIGVHLKHSQEELNSIIRNEIPRQFSKIKTVLWINVLFIGLVLTKSNRELNILDFSFLACAFIAIVFCLRAMHYGNRVHYGNAEKVTYMSKATSKYNALHSQLHMTIKGIRYNGMIITKRSKLIKRAIEATVAAVLSLILSVAILYYEKDFKHVGKTIKPTTIKTDSVQRRQENSTNASSRNSTAEDAN